MADVFCQCGLLWPLYERADDVAIVADGIATFCVMTDVIVIVAAEIATLWDN